MTSFFKIYLVNLPRLCYNDGANRCAKVKRPAFFATVFRVKRKNAAEASGFRSVRTFYRAFREVFGSSPKEYLESTRKPY